MDIDIAGVIMSMRTRREIKFPVACEAATLADPVSVPVAVPTTTATEQDARTNATIDTTETSITRSEEEESSAAAPSRPRKKSRLSIKELENQTYWDSPEARKWVLPPEDEDCETVLRRRIEKLKVAQKVNGWKEVIRGGDPQNRSTLTEIVSIRQRALFLLMAYQIALEKMSATVNRPSWCQCCQMACKQLNALGFTLTVRGDRVEVYNKQYREDEFFPHPNWEARITQNPLPRIFQVFPSAKEQMEDFCTAKMPNLTAEAAQGFMTETVLPETYKIWRKEQIREKVMDGTSDTVDNDRFSYAAFRKSFRLREFSIHTASNYMKRVGIQYDEARKCWRWPQLPRIRKKKTTSDLVQE